jgi:hypothetical protein
MWSFVTGFYSFRTVFFHVVGEKIYKALPDKITLLLYSIQNIFVETLYSYNPNNYTMVIMINTIKEK